VTTDLLATALKMSVWLALLLNVAPVMSWVERRGCALIQDRPGPNRLGPLGLFQALADAVKFLFKETPMPNGADKLLYLMAPALAIVPALTTYVVLPFGPTMLIDGQPMALSVSNGDTGVLLLLALASFGVYSLVLAGYSSNSKWSLMGSIRASAQMISYELALTLAVVAALLPTESLRLDAVVAYQQGFWFSWVPKWNVFPQIVGFFVFLVAAFAETNRLPFDLSEAESELVAGYHTEYGGMRFALFMMGEYMSMAVLSALGATLYFGGWSLPGVDVLAIGATLGGVLPASVPADVAAAVGTGLVGMGILVAKIFAFMLLFVWIRWTFPRFRYDQLMRLGWKLLLPLALFNLVAMAALTIGGWI
jgi:NADH-quinone oxidoreductase subunit H